MKLSTFKTLLAPHPAEVVRVILPDGDPIPAHFHVTEVGHVTKRFIDCGGTLRTSESCLLQTWVPDDGSDHRLTAGKLGHILNLAKQVVPSDELEVEFEYDCCVVGQYIIEDVASDGSVLTIKLANKTTDCLARESCGVDGSECGCSSGQTTGACC
jgi:hypothetical protein